MPCPGGFVGLGNLPARKIGRADIQDLALLDEHFHGLPDLLPGRQPVHVVELVQVDMVGLHAPQRFFTGVPDVQRRKTGRVGPVAHVPVDLGGNDDLFASRAALRKPAPDDLFGDALAGLPAVDVGGIEEVNAQVEGFVHDDEAIGFGRLGAKVHRPEAQTGNFQAGAAQLREFHDFLLKMGRDVRYVPVKGYLLESSCTVLSISSSTWPALSAEGVIWNREKNPSPNTRRALRQLAACG
jgi:hypothetical protein